MIDNKKILDEVSKFAKSATFPRDDQRNQVLGVNDIVTANSDLKMGDYNFTVHYDVNAKTFKVELIIPMTFPTN